MLLDLLVNACLSMNIQGQYHLNQQFYVQHEVPIQPQWIFSQELEVLALRNSCSQARGIATESDGSPSCRTAISTHIAMGARFSVSTDNLYNEVRDLMYLHAYPMVSQRWNLNMSAAHLPLSANTSFPSKKLLFYEFSSSTFSFSRTTHLFPTSTRSYTC